VLHVTLRARLGRWYPDGDRRPGPLVVAAFATDTGTATPSPARVRTSVGETYDFEWAPVRPGRLRLEVRNGGQVMVEQAVEVH
jgi:hypothetical protein